MLNTSRYNSNIHSSAFGNVHRGFHQSGHCSSDLRESPDPESCIWLVSYLVYCIGHDLERLNVCTWLLSPSIPVSIHFMPKLNQH